MAHAYTAQQVKKDYNFFVKKYFKNVWKRLKKLIFLENWHLFEVFFFGKTALNLFDVTNRLIIWVWSYFPKSTIHLFTYGCTTCRTLFGIGRNPIWCFWIIVAFFDPFFNQMATNWIMPILWTSKTKRMATYTLHWLGFNVRRSNGIRTIGSWAPSH